MAGAPFGEVHVSLFVAGAAFGEVHVSLFVAGAAFGEVHVSLFVAGAACGEIWNDSRSFGMIAGAGNVVIFNRISSAKSSLGGAAGSVLRFQGRIMLGSFSDHARIMVGSVAHWKCHFSCFQQISVRCWVVILRGRRSIW